MHVYRQTSAQHGHVNTIRHVIRGVFNHIHADVSILSHIRVLVRATSGARLTKAYDVTIQRCRNLHAKIQDSRMHILRCMGSKFCVKFQRCPMKFHAKSLTHTPRNMHLTRCWNLTIDDILELLYRSLSETGPWSGIWFVIDASSVLTILPLSASFTPSICLLMA